MLNITSITPVYKKTGDNEEIGTMFEIFVPDNDIRAMSDKLNTETLRRAAQGDEDPIFLLRTLLHIAYTMKFRDSDPFAINWEILDNELKTRKAYVGDGSGAGTINGSSVVGELKEHAKDKHEPILDLSNLYVNHLVMNLENRSIANILEFLGRYCGFGSIGLYILEKIKGGEDDQN